MLAPELQSPEEAARKQAEYEARRAGIYVEVYGPDGATKKAGRDTGVKK